MLQYFARRVDKEKSSWADGLQAPPKNHHNIRLSFCHLCRKIAAYDEEIQHLYEEMEQQIKTEKEQFLLKVRVHSSPGLGCAGQAEIAKEHLL